VDELDVIIREAFLKHCEELYADMPTQEELEKMHTFSDKHNERMQEIFNSIGIRDSTSPE